jgi:acyl-CoA reductase-like NAD-dependent aldehyde dehydrogenase
MVVKEPYGVHLGIAPRNASLFLAMRAVMTPISCGNTAVLKASELCPAAHNFIARMLSNVGFPAGVLNVIQHRREDAAEVLEAMIAHPAVKKVNFTGSTAVGKIIAGMTARYCKPTLMELGGKAPQVVFEDADLDEAAQAAVVGGFLHVSRILLIVAFQNIGPEMLTLASLPLSTAKYACQQTLSLLMNQSPKS